MSKSREKAVADLPFEEALAEMDEIVRNMESGQLSLAEALAAYERGIVLIKHCHGLLKSSEARIVELAGKDEFGQPKLKPFLGNPQG